MKTQKAIQDIIYIETLSRAVRLLQAVRIQLKI